MSLFYNNKFWFFDQLNKKKRNENFELVRKLYISNIPTEVIECTMKRNDYFRLYSHVMYYFQLATVEQLTRKFRQYGKIESIEVHTDQYFVEDHQSKYPNYAYVTFSESSSAHKALIAKKTSFKKEPASTWKQPIDSIEVEVEPTDEDYFNRLNEHCLLELFSYLSAEELIKLSQVSKRLHSLIHERVFSRMKELKLDCGSWNKAALTLAQLRQTVLTYGRHAEKIDFFLPFTENDEKYADRMVDVFTKHVGDNLVVLKIHNLVLTSRMVLQFKRCFEKLRVLKWRGRRQYRYVYDMNTQTYEFQKHDTDLISACVNLEQLTITQNHEFQANSGPWQKLKMINIGFYGVSNKQLLNFFMNNPQITNLKILADTDFYVLMEDIQMYLPNLEKLIVYGIINDLDIEDIDVLLGLQKIRELKLGDIQVEMIEYLLQIVATLPELEEFAVNVFTGERAVFPQLSFKALVVNSPKLKKFCIIGYKLTEPMILEFIRYNGNLEVFAFYKADISMSKELLLRMCAAHKQSLRSKSGPLEINVDTFDDKEIDNLASSDDVSKCIKLTKNDFFVEK